MDFDLQYYKRWAAVRRKLGLVGMILGFTAILWPVLLALMAIFEGRALGSLSSALALFGWMLVGFSQFWVWGRETQGLVAEIEKLRAMKLPETRTEI